MIYERIMNVATKQWQIGAIDNHQARPLTDEELEKAITRLNMPDIPPASAGAEGPGLRVVKHEDGFWLHISGNPSAAIHLGAADDKGSGPIVQQALENAALAARTVEGKAEAREALLGDLKLVKARELVSDIGDCSTDETAIKWAREALGLIDDFMARPAPTDGLLRVAVAIYEACRQEAISSSRPIIPEPFEMRDGSFREQFQKTIERLTAKDYEATPEREHDSWTRAYEKMGWKYGVIRDPKAKTHPDMVPFDELPESERQKDAIFMACCFVARAALAGSAAPVGSDSEEIERASKDPSALINPSALSAGVREAAQALIAALYAYDKLTIDQGMRHAKADAGREVWYRRSMLEAALQSPEPPQGEAGA